jgi:hypothetical protein
VRRRKVSERCGFFGFKVSKTYFLMVFSIILVEFKFMMIFQGKKSLTKSNNRYPEQVTPMSIGAMEPCMPIPKQYGVFKSTNS